MAVLSNDTAIKLCSSGSVATLAIFDFKLMVSIAPAAAGWVGATRPMDWLAVTRPRATIDSFTRNIAQYFKEMRCHV